MLSIFLIIPLLWGIGAGLGVLLTLFGGFAIFCNFKDEVEEGDVICFLGMHLSGKSYLLSKLRNVKHIKGNTYKDEFEQFSFKVDDKNIYIKTAKDFGGDVSLRNHYNEAVNTSKYIFFLFDVNKYLSADKNYEYRRECNSRFSQIYNLKSENAYYIATHVDLVKKSENEIKKELSEILMNKEYKSIVERMLLINLTDDKQFEKFKKETFGKQN